MNQEQNFRKILARFAGQDGCWEWPLSRNRVSGYGQYRIDGTVRGAHRVAYEMSIGPIPYGLFVCHRCDNRPCINPGHLFLGDVRDNTQDMISKGRQQDYRNQARGEQNGVSKLSVDMVLAIRSSSLSQRAAARMYGISQTNVRDIQKRRIWRHV